MLYYNITFSSQFIWRLDRWSSCRLLQSLNYFYRRYFSISKVIQLIILNLFTLISQWDCFYWILRNSFRFEPLGFSLYLVVFKVVKNKKKEKKERYGNPDCDSWLFLLRSLKSLPRLSPFYRDSDNVDHSRRFFVSHIEYKRRSRVQRDLYKGKWIHSFESMRISYACTFKYGI